MSRICEATGKGVMFGGSRQHNRGKAGGVSGPWSYKATRTTRTWRPNLRTVDVKVNNAPTNVKLSMKAYKKLKTDGKIWLQTRSAYAYL